MVRGLGAGAGAFNPAEQKKYAKELTMISKKFFLMKQNMLVQSQKNYLLIK